MDKHKLRIRLQYPLLIGVLAIILASPLLAFPLIGQKNEAPPLNYQIEKNDDIQKKSCLSAEVARDYIEKHHLSDIARDATFLAKKLHAKLMSVELCQIEDKMMVFSTLLQHGGKIIVTKFEPR